MPMVRLRSCDWSCDRSVVDGSAGDESVVDGRAAAAGGDDSVCRLMLAAMETRVNLDDKTLEDEEERIWYVQYTLHLAPPTDCIHAHVHVQYMYTCTCIHMLTHGH